MLAEPLMLLLFVLFVGCIYGAVDKAAQKKVKIMALANADDNAKEKLASIKGRGNLVDKPTNTRSDDPHASIPLQGGPKGSSSRSKKSSPKPPKPQGDGNKVARRNVEPPAPAGWATNGLPPEVGPDAAMLPPEAEADLDAMADAIAESVGFDDVDIIDVDQHGWDEEIIPYSP